MVNAAQAGEAATTSVEERLEEAANPVASSRWPRVGVWPRFFARRLTRMVVTLFIIVTTAFIVVRLAPGDPVLTALGPNAPIELVEQRRAALGLDLPLWQQYVQYLGGLLRGDLGESIVTGESVTQIVSTRLPQTAMLAVLAVAVVLVIAIPAGMIIAILTQNGRRRSVELTFNAGTGLIAAVPEYLLAVGLVVVFGMLWPVLPVAGSGSPAAFVLPVIALAAASAATIGRIARVEGLKVLQQDYMRTARAKRLPSFTLYARHAIPNMLTAVLTLGGSALAGLVVGSALVEQVFNWPGLGYSLIQSISARDYSVVVGIALVYAAIIVIINLAVDVVLALTDRRTAILSL
ncbi:ABC transporter permease [Microbacterium sp. NPDC077663]|uniref:ABC transporter permease n=1 Tax=Microbacterium sp. NPDC077663 TaxID=3364189 RepID=UPI0037C6039A